MSACTVAARSAAEMPVVVPARASTETVNAVRWVSVLCATIKRQRERVAPVTLERLADHAARVADHERDRLRGHLLRRHDQVALVLTVGIVDDDDELAALDGRDRVLDLGEGHQGSFDAAASGVSRRSTYFASTSTSMFTPSPALRVPRVVCSSVWGISATATSPERLLVGPGHGQADAVDRDRALLDDVAPEVARDLDRDDGGPVGGRSSVDDPPDAVDMALDEVTAEAVGETHGPLEVHAVARGEAPERRAGEGLGLRVGSEPAVARARRR